MEAELRRSCPSCWNHAASAALRCDRADCCGCMCTANGLAVEEAVVEEGSDPATDCDDEDGEITDDELADVDPRRRKNPGIAGREEGREVGWVLLKLSSKTTTLFHGRLGAGTVRCLDWTW